MNKNKGFTLIELLVVIAIIGFMSAIGLTLFSEAQKKARDGQRKLDISSIAKTLEIHKTDNGYQVLNTGWFEKGAIPVDPVSTRNYCGHATATTDPLDSDYSSTVNGGCPSNGDSPYSHPLSSTNPVAAADQAKWRICARLETEDKWFCKHQVQ